MNVTGVFERLTSGREVSPEEEAALADRCVHALLLLERHERLAKELRSAGGDEFQTLALVRRYLSETDIEPALIMPIMRRVGELYDLQMRGAGRAGSASTPFNTFAPMAFLAAAVHARHKRRGGLLRDAIGDVARAADVETKNLKSFFKNCQSHNLRSETIDAYGQWLDILMNEPNDLFDGELKRLIALTRNYLSLDYRTNP